MNNKLNNMLNDFFKENEGKFDSELNEKLEEFLNKYNSGEIEYENTPLDNAYELLEKANEYLERVKKVNSNFVKFFKGTIKVNENVPFGCYSIGDSSEVLMYFDNYLFLMMSVPGIGDYVLKNSKKTKNN